MPVFINPFDANPGFTLADMTRAIQLMPLTSTVIGDMGLFGNEGTTQFTITIEKQDHTLNLLPTVHRGGPATVGTTDPRNMRSFRIPHIPHNDVILPSDIQGVRQFGSATAAETVSNVLGQKMQKMRDRHSQTLEFMRLNALKGLLRDGAGTTIADFYADWGVSKVTVDLVLGTAGTDVAGKLRVARRGLARALRGENMSSSLVLMSPSLWDKFIKHATILEAYKYFASTSNPMREDLRTDFTYQGVRFREYDTTFTLFGGSTEEALATDKGLMIPLGTRDTFSTVFAPADLMETVNTVGQELYARQITRLDGKGIDLMTESNPFPYVRRPELVIEITSSN